MGYPNDIVVKPIFTAKEPGKGCNASVVRKDGSTPARGGRAWATTIHENTSSTPATRDVTESALAKADLMPAELYTLAGIRDFLETYTPKFGICRSCQPGAR